MPVVKIVNPDGKIVWFVRLSFSLKGLLYFRSSEIMSVERGAEHRSGQVIGIVELQRHVAVGMEQGRVAHTHGDVSVAEAHV